MIKISYLFKITMSLFITTIVYKLRRHLLVERTVVRVEKSRMVNSDFWNNPVVLEEMTPEDKYFYFYLLTNPHSTKIGIYRITKEQIALGLGYTIESVHPLMERFIQHYKLIRYNPETRELAIKNWGKLILLKGGEQLIDYIHSELKEVKDKSLILYVSKSIGPEEIRGLYESFCEKEEVSSGR
jgi:hypothetical protein